MTAIQAALNELSCGDQIRSRPCRNCYICGAEGHSLYQDLKDRYFAAPGVWNMKKCRNALCGLVWLDPIPEKNDIGKAYLSYYTHSDEAVAPIRVTLARRLIRAVKTGYLARKYGYGSSEIGLLGKSLGLAAYLMPPRRANVDFSIMYLPHSRGGRLLEVGCGSGNMLKGMADLGWRVEGVDFDPAAVENSRRKGLKVHIGFLKDMRYAEDCFDAVTMSHLIEHVHDPLELLKECHRILRPGGRLALVTPNINSAGHRIYGSSWFHLDPPRHLRIFTVDSLRTLLQEAGFQKTKIGTTIRDAGTAYVASRSVQRTERYEMGSRQPWSARFWGKAMQAMEWAWLKLDSQAGEEIAAMAQK
jgi:2-polyprenyl-3-methyl-5-hydroxy-6-metoxy-1,4-benzoquinol methylase